VHAVACSLACDEPQRKRPEVLTPGLSHFVFRSPGYSCGTLVPLHRDRQFLIEKTGRPSDDDTWRSARISGATGGAIGGAIGGDEPAIQTLRRRSMAQLPSRSGSFVFVFHL